MIGGGEGESPLICDGGSVKRMSCVDDSGEMVDGSGTYKLNIGTSYVCSVDGGVPGSHLDGVVCLSVFILSIISVIVLILMQSCVRIKYKYRYKYISKTRISVFK